MLDASLLVSVLFPPTLLAWFFFKKNNFMLVSILFVYNDIIIKCGMRLISRVGSISKWPPHNLDLPGILEHC